MPKQRRPAPGIDWHVTLLPSDKITLRSGIPVTTVPRTLFNLATTVRPRQLEAR